MNVPSQRIRCAVAGFCIGAAPLARLRGQAAGARGRKRREMDLFAV
jgi:hypothetical protein